MTPQVAKWNPFQGNPQSNSHQPETQNQIPIQVSKVYRENFFICEFYLKYKKYSNSYCFFSKFLIIRKLFFGLSIEIFIFTIMNKEANYKFSNKNKKIILHQHSKVVNKTSNSGGFQVSGFRVRYQTSGIFGSGIRRVPDDASTHGRFGCQAT